MSGDWIIRRARPKDLLRLSEAPAFSDQARALASKFCDYSYLLLETASGIKGFLGWDILNLVACLADLQIADLTRWDEYAAALIRHVETEAEELRGEVAILFLPADLPAKATAGVEAAGYAATELAALISPWREAAREHIVEGQRLWVKRLNWSR
jgi:hypothetical protein